MIVAAILATGILINARAPAAAENKARRTTADPTLTDAGTAPIFPPLVRAPLDTPLVVTGGFGESRSGHFHAGLDLGTGGRVGRPVYAPLSGWIERVRASGVGYGRSLYLKSEDGRLLVFGHLDAFDEPMASLVAGRQDSSGQYEQDLWPEPGSVPIRAGERIAWTGESGAGGPHLHFEIRRGDMALNPLRAGMQLRDTRAPSLVRLVLEPLDDGSRVEGSPAPYVMRLGPGPDTVSVTGRVRVLVGARDGVWQGVDRMVPWSVRIEFRGRAVECRFDSASWATDMAEAEYVYDYGRVVGGREIMMWAPPGFRPRVLRADDPPVSEAGTVTMRPGDREETLSITAMDLGGNEVRRDVLLRPGSPVERDPVLPLDTRSPASRTAGIVPPDWRQLGIGSYVARARPEWISVPGDVRYTSLPGRRLRITLAGSRWRKFGIDVFSLGGLHAFTGSGERRAATVTLGSLPLEEPLVIGSSGNGAARWWARTPVLRVSAAENGATDGIPGFEWRIPRDGLFEPAVFVAETLHRASGTPELSPVGPVYALHPDDFPLRAPLKIRIASPRKHPPRRTGVYRDDGGGWEFVGSQFDEAAGVFEVESRHLGRFGLFRDVAAPRVRPLVPKRRASGGPYSRWALEATLVEEGSGVNARDSYFMVDGRRVPSEWDSEEKILRWRPRRAPLKGRHRYELVVADRAGNIARRSGAFVLD